MIRPQATIDPRPAIDRDDSIAVLLQFNVASGGAMLRIAPE
jgi:hypothetical protein